MPPLIIPLHTDHFLYTKKMADGSLLILVLYVDDMLIAEKDKHNVDALKSKLSETFAMKDLGNASHILGMQINRNRSRQLLYLSQQLYVEKVLKRFNMEREKSTSTPLAPYVKLSKADCPKSDTEKAEMTKVPYASACGSLMYAMIATRPDIAFAVGVVSRFTSNPGKKHWKAFKGVLRYLNGIKDMCICFGKGDLSVVGYTDADYAGDLDKRRSTSGYIYTFAGGAISWFSRLQSCTTLSTTEVEYVAASDACKEAIWLTHLVGDLGIVGEASALHCDSQSAIQLARNPVFHAKLKHVDIRLGELEVMPKGRPATDSWVKRLHPDDLPHIRLHLIELVGEHWAAKRQRLHGPPNFLANASDGDNVNVEKASAAAPETAQNGMAAGSRKSGKILSDFSSSNSCRKLQVSEAVAAADLLRPDLQTSHYARQGAGAATSSSRDVSRTPPFLLAPPHDAFHSTDDEGVNLSLTLAPPRASSNIPKSSSRRHPDTDLHLRLTLAPPIWRCPNSFQ
ncbi:hypothetical protein L7F22_053639 [Adiantum nelumboides]|nr:hypothetical protein [Adiantum nelumboides]